jgi:dTDP-4-dehydrorhamnose reductase
MKIVVLGAGGQLGRAMVQHVTRDHNVVAWTRADVDITNPDALGAALRTATPEAVINCAAFARVDEAEDAPAEALAANAWAVRDLARLSRAMHFTLMHYSTDFVFDGVESAPRRETDSVNPRGVYATSKLIGEWFAAEAPREYVLRVESLFGGDRTKSSVDVLLQGLRTGQDVRAFADRTVSPSFVDDVARVSLEMLTRSVAFGLYHCVNTGTTTWLELTQELARLAGVSDAGITPVNMAGLTMRVPRPLHAALSNDKLRAAGIEVPTWQDALARYVGGSR